MTVVMVVIAVRQVARGSDEVWWRWLQEVVMVLVVAVWW